MHNNQQTVKQQYTFQGKGLHTGKNVTLTISPAPVGTGIVFHRTDLGENAMIKGVVDYVSTTQRSTTLEHGGVKVSTVEHILSALYGLEVDNALITLDSEEAPILDGSAGPYAKAISADGLQEQDEPKMIFEIKEKISYKDPQTGAELTIMPDDEFSIDLMIDYNSKVLGSQYARYSQEVDYTSEIAPCRTFVFFHELEYLFKNDLIKGGDLENAIVIVEKEVPQEELDRMKALFNVDHIKRVPEGYLNNVELRFNNECARHKLLDVIGDFALVGFPIKGKVIANKSGHKINTKIAKLIREAAIKQFHSRGIPQYDPDKTPIYDVNGIKALLPHRPPFLMVDRILEKSEEKVIGVKTIGINEGFFIGHFPEEPVMPGVLIVEAMAQVGGILVLSGLDEPEKYSTYFLKINNVKFKKKVVPGDVLVIELILTEPLRRSIVSMSGKVYVGNTLVCEGDMVAQVIKNIK